MKDSFDHLEFDLGLCYQVADSEARWGNQIFHMEGPAGSSDQWRRDPVAERILKGGNVFQELTFKLERSLEVRLGWFLSFSETASQEMCMMHIII